MTAFRLLGALVLRAFIIVAAVFLPISTGSASAGRVKIPWDVDHPTDGDEPYSDSNPLASAWTRNFLNGTPEEGGRVVSDGELAGEMLKPPGKGPFPFVIILHGCSGLTPAVNEWARIVANRMVKEGFGALILDSFKPRRVKETCGPPDYRWGIRRANDSFSALSFLVKHGHADPTSVFILGSSNGGRAVLSAMDERIGRDRINRFAAGFAIVPRCHLREPNRYYGPIIIFGAENDDPNPVHFCREIAQQQHIAPFHLIIFKGTNHGYMYPQFKQQYADKRGWRLKYDAAASKVTLDAVADAIKTRKFVSAVEQR